MIPEPTNDPEPKTLRITQVTVERVRNWPTNRIRVILGHVNYLL